MAESKGKAWGETSRIERRWPASLAVVAAALLYLTLPGKFSIGPSWVIPAIEMLILIPLSIVAPNRRPHEGRFTQYAVFALIGIVNVANVTALAQLVRALVFHAERVTGQELLFSAIAIWFTNVVVFSLWFYELDRGGPDERLRADHSQPDFLYPQMTTPDCTHDRWSPHFVDYLYVSFTNATAFSPTDTMPLTLAAKTLMLVESLVSLGTITIVASRAVNILN